MLNSLGLLVGKRKRLDPAGEVIADDEQVPISLFRQRQRPHDVDAQTIQWCPDAEIGNGGAIFALQHFCHGTCRADADMQFHILLDCVPMEPSSHAVKCTTYPYMTSEQWVMAQSEHFLFKGRRN